MTTDTGTLQGEHLESGQVSVPLRRSAEMPRPPAWLREFETAVVTNPQIMIYGNVRDHYLIPFGDGSWRFLGIRDAVSWALGRLGYPVTVTVDVVDGVGCLPGGEEAAKAATQILPSDVKLGAACTLRSLGAILTTAVHQGDPQRPVTARDRQPSAPAIGAVLVDYAARLIRGLPQLDGEEHVLFATAEKLSHTARPVLWPDGTRRYNPVIWIVNHERELPSWFIAGNDGVRRIAVPMPELDDRLTAARVLAPGLIPPGAPADEREAEISRFAEHTHGLTLRSMTEIVRLSRSGQPDVKGIEDAARSYRVGILDNPWGKPALRRRLAGATEALSRRVRGQEQAIQHSVDIIVRSVMGLSGAQAGNTSSRPRGVMFFAGPTGVGKTELAKALAELIFGDERACIRFDMSEFAAAHAAERLVGSPPGYLGHDAGGELTNAVRERPFSLILFDEIEKADRSILDKFLQILDDGRLTDGSGSTVYFSEAVIVFTSNLGMKVQNADGVIVDNVGPELDRSELARRLTTAVRDHFTSTLNRPELLNRIGDNIVVFNFISSSAAAEIFDSQLARVCERVERQDHVRLEVPDAIRDRLRAEATADLGFGGRGIGSFLETAFVNPLARALFEQTETGHDLASVQLVTRVDQVDGVWRLQLESAR